MDSLSKLYPGKIANKLMMHFCKWHRRIKNLRLFQMVIFNHDQPSRWHIIQTCRNGKRYAAVVANIKGSYKLGDI